MRNFSTFSEMRKGQKKRNKIIGNTQRYINAVKWKAYDVENTQAMQDDALIRTAIIHPAFIPVTGLKCSYGKNFQPALQRFWLEIPRSRESSQQSPLSYEHIKNFTKDSDVKRDLGNRAARPTGL